MMKWIYSLSFRTSASVVLLGIFECQRPERASKCWDHTQWGTPTLRQSPQGISFIACHYNGLVIVVVACVVHWYPHSARLYQDAIDSARKSTEKAMKTIKEYHRIIITITHASATELSSWHITCVNKNSVRPELMVNHAQTRSSAWRRKGTVQKQPLKETTKQSTNTLPCCKHSKMQYVVFFDVQRVVVVVTVVLGKANLWWTHWHGPTSIPQGRCSMPCHGNNKQYNTHRS